MAPVNVFVAFGDHVIDSGVYVFTKLTSFVCSNTISPLATFVVACSTVVIQLFVLFALFSSTVYLASAGSPKIVMVWSSSRVIVAFPLVSNVTSVTEFSNSVLSDVFTT